MEMLSQPQAWRYGYDLTKVTGLRSGTLYPLLIRLSDQGLLESEWHPALQPGRPARHAYRLTQDGVAFAKSLSSTLPQRVARRQNALEVQR